MVTSEIIFNNSNLYFNKNCLQIYKQNICCCCSVSCLVMSDSLQPMDYNMPGFSVLHYLPELIQIHIHWVSNAIQPSHPKLPSSLFAFNLSQYQGVFQWVVCKHPVVKLLELQLQHQSFQRIFRTDFLLGLTGWISLQSKGLSRVFSSTTTWKHQFFGIQPSLWSNSNICTWLLEKP